LSSAFAAGSAGATRVSGAAPEGVNGKSSLEEARSVVGAGLAAKGAGVKIGRSGTGGGGTDSATATGAGAVTAVTISGAAATGAGASLANGFLYSR